MVWTTSKVPVSDEDAEESPIPHRVVRDPLPSVNEIPNGPNHHTHENEHGSEHNPRGFSAPAGPGMMGPRSSGESEPPEAGSERNQEHPDKAAAPRTHSSHTGPRPVRARSLRDIFRSPIHVSLIEAKQSPPVEGLHLINPRPRQDRQPGLEPPVRGNEELDVSVL